MTANGIFPQLQGHQYLSLTTYRKSGEGVASPVWFAIDGDRLYIVTGQGTGKVKRVRNNPRVTMVASDGRGQPVPGAPTLEGLATIIPMEPGGRGDRALRAKYRWVYRMFAWFFWLRRIEPVLLEVREA